MDTADSKTKMTIYLAHWFDIEDKMFRVAGVYRTKRAAWRRVNQLDGGTVQALTLGRAVRFTHEPANFRQSSKNDPAPPGVGGARAND